jgi:diguanylate cyclase (GGDEF)-like protein
MWPTDRSKIYSADLRRFTRIIQGAILVFGLLLIAIIAYAGWAANQSATERERMLLDNALNQSVARALNEQKSVAWWDDSVVKITDSAIDLDFVDANFGIFLTETYGHDEVYIVNARDNPVYAFTNAQREDPSTFERRRPTLAALIEEIRTGTPTTLKTRPDAFAAQQSNYRVLGGVLHSARWAGHIISVDGHPAVVAALTIVPNVNMDLLRGDPNLLISITFIDDPFISEIGSSLLLDDLTMSASPETRAGMVTKPYFGDDGILAGNLTWTTKRPGQVLLTIILPLVILAIFATGMFSNNMLHQLTRASEELAQREADARHEAKHDALSGLPNRIHMIEKIDAVLARLGTGGNDHAVAAYLDIDRFKDINDTLGHESGDQLIKAVTQRLKTCLKAQDFLSRFGGDEFAILSAPTDSDGAAALAARVAEVFAAPFTINGQSIRVTASVGLAIAPEHGRTSDELIRHADIALYEAKNRGRDRAVQFTAEMAQHVEERRAIELDLRAALESNELRLYYQPGAIHALGFKTALDDFGTGYSSRLPLVRVRLGSLLPALLRRAAWRRRSRHPLRRRCDEACKPRHERRPRRRGCRHRAQSHPLLLRFAACAPADRMGIFRKQRSLARSRAEARRHATSVAPLLGRNARRLRTGLAASREPDSAFAREGDRHTRIGVRPAAAHVGRRDDVLLRRIHHRTA